MSKREKKASSSAAASKAGSTTASEHEGSLHSESTPAVSAACSSIIKGVCDDSLLNGKCDNVDCDLLHILEPISLVDGHFHDRLLKENWSCTIEPLANIDQFIGITNVHKSSMWDDTNSIVLDSLKFKVRLYEAYGIHPRYLADNPHKDLLRLRHLAQTRPMVGIGECGLDVLNADQLSSQIEIFTAQIALANEFHLPLIVHCRQLDQQLFDLLRKHALDASMKIQWHCCHSRGVSVYREFLNYFPSSILSIGGMSCHSGEKNLQRLVRELHENMTSNDSRRFVFETDAPYLKPSALQINSDENCPMLGTLAVSAFLTKQVLKSDQWTNNLKINAETLQKFFNLT